MSIEFSEKIQTYMQAKGLIQSELAAIATVPATTLSSWILDHVSPRKFIQVLLIARALELTKQETDFFLSLANRKFKTIENYHQLLEDEPSESELHDLLSFWPTFNPNAPFQAGPLHTDILFGRKIVLEQLQNALREATPCVIRGMGGIGKSALAVQLAYDLRSDFPDGILRVNLSDTIADNGEVKREALLSYIISLMNAFGRSLEQKEIHTLESYQGYLRQVLANKKALIIYDDVPNNSALSPLLPPNTSQCAILITTRNRGVLRKRPDAKLIDLDVLNSEDSKDFLRHQLGSEAHRIDDEERNVNRVLRMVDGLPLALDMIKPNVEDITFYEYAELIEDEKTRLSYMSEWDEISTDLKAVFSVSFLRLSEDAKRVFSYLSLFKSNHFDKDVITFLGDLSSGLTQRILNEISNLSLITPYQAKCKSEISSQKQINNRYRVHDLLRVFSSYQLQNQELAYSQLHLKFANHYTQFSQVQASKLAYNLIDIEWDNIDQALIWLIEKKHTERAMNLILNLTQFWVGSIGYLDLRGKYLEACSYIENLLKHTGLSENFKIKKADLLIRLGAFYLRQNHLNEANQCFLEGLTILKSEQTETYIKLLKGYAAGYLAETQFEKNLKEDAIETIEEGLEQLESLNLDVAQHQIGYLKSVQGVFIVRSGGSTEKAIDIMNQAIDLLPEQVTPSHLKIYNDLANIYSYTGAIEKHNLYRDKQISTAIQLGDIRRQGLGNMNKAVILQKIGQYDEALKRGKEASSLFRQIMNPGLVDALQNLGRTYMILEQVKDANEWLLKALDASEEFPEYLEGRAYVLTTLAELMTKQEKFVEVESLLKTALEMCQTHQLNTLMPAVQNCLALLKYLEKDTAQALKHANLAISLGDSAGHLEYMGVGHLIKAQTLEKMGLYEEAETCYQESLKLLESEDVYEYKKAFDAYENFKNGRSSS